MSPPPAGPAPAPLPLSVFVIAGNEADRIGPVLAAVRALADDLLVVDSGSTDATREVAATHGARVVINTPWPGYGPQKRIAEDLCRHDWVLNLDADEWVPPALADEIRALFAAGAPPKDAYRLRIAETFPGEAAPHRWAYTLTPVRLYRRSVGRYSPSPVHDRVALPPGTPAGMLRTFVHHFSVRSMGDQIAKLNAYSDQQADDLDARGARIAAWRIFFEFPAAFLKAYVARRHFVRGTYGFMTATNYAFSRHLRLAKHLERRWQRRWRLPGEE